MVGRCRWIVLSETIMLGVWNNVEVELRPSDFWRCGNFWTFDLNSIAYNHAPRRSPGQAHSSLDHLLTYCANMAPANMLRQSLLRATRAATVRASEARMSSRLHQPQTIFTCSAGPSRSFSVSRRYLAEAEASKADASKEGEAAAPKDDALTKELEAKKKEVVDVTVCLQYACIYRR